MGEDGFDMTTPKPPARGSLSTCESDQLIDADVRRDHEEDER